MWTSVRQVCTGTCLWQAICAATCSGPRVSSRQGRIGLIPFQLGSADRPSARLPLSTLYEYFAGGLQLLLQHHALVAPAVYAVL
ncbi:hypothetical protein V8C40DRAFT_257866 [Trichoderma camerunense]